MSPRPPTRRSTRPASSPSRRPRRPRSSSTNGWKTFFRALGNDDTQGPAAAKYIKDTVKATKVFVIDDASEYGKGLADIVRSDLGSTVVGNDTIQQKQTDFGASVTKVTASGADALFFGGYDPEAAPLIKQLRDAGWKGTFVVADGVKSTGLPAERPGRRRGHDHHLPVRPAGRRAGLPGRLQGQVQRGPQHLLG